MKIGNFSMQEILREFGWLVGWPIEGYAHKEARLDLKRWTTSSKSL